MAPVTAHGGSSADTALAEQRIRLAGAPGMAGFARNARTVGIAFFASMGGLVYGYNQGMFGQILSMSSFTRASGVTGIENPTVSGLLTSILELGAWVGVLWNGYLSDRVGRKQSVVFACAVFGVGVIVQACTHGRSYDYILGGRFVTGIGVGGLSMIVPLYNAELAPPEVRGALVAVQQLAITFGIMISYWITYGTNYIGGTGSGQSKAAWLVPITIQIVPAAILAVGMMMLPESPRWLMNEGREEDALNVLCNLRRLPSDDPLIKLEFLELKAQRLFETRLLSHDFPNLVNDKSRMGRIKLGIKQYMSLVNSRSNRKRLMVAVLTMLFQQWTGVNFVLYYAPFIFQAVGLDSSNTISLLASGVVGIVMFLATIPAVLYIDTWGRKPTLISGAIIMGVCHFIISGIIGQCRHDWDKYKAAGWVAAVFVWIFSAAFGFSWGPCAWIVVSEVFPLGLRAKGVSIGASSNWLNNFAVAMSTPDFVAAAPFGAYIFLGLMCIIGAFYVYFFVPETKQRTLDELDVLFGDKSGRSSMESAMLLQAQHDVGLLGMVWSDEQVDSHLDNKPSFENDDHEREKPIADHVA